MGPKRLYLFTGKGGVGKSTLALAQCLYLKNQGHRVHYASFMDSGMGITHSTDFNQELQNFLQLRGVPAHFMSLQNTIEEYMTHKLHSQLIAKWIGSQRFFRSLINMIPGFNNVIYLGKLYAELQQNPDDIYVIDAPATGHCKVLLNAVYNFKEIFFSGLLFEDCEQLSQVLDNPDFLKINVVTLPTDFSLNETHEFISELRQQHRDISNIFYNSLLPQKLDYQVEYLANKAKKQGEVVQSITNGVEFIAQNDFFDIVEALAQQELEFTL